MDVKVCSKCGKIGLDQIDFTIHWQSNNNKYNYRTFCYECQYKQEKERRSKCLEKGRKAVRRYQAKNKELTKERYRLYYHKKYQQWKEFLIDLGYDKCSVCGYNKCFAALDFHHVIPSGKEQTISRLTGCAFTEKRKELVKKELKKCVVLCANCHRELHSKGGKNDKSQYKTR